MHFSCIQHILLKFLIPTRTRSITIIHFHGQTKVDQFQNPKILEVMVLDWFICHCGWKRLNFTLGNENAERYQWVINGNHASPYSWISAEKDPRSAELRRTFCDVEFRRKKIFSAEILGKTIESAEVHYTKPEDEFR